MSFSVCLECGERDPKIINVDNGVIPGHKNYQYVTQCCDAEWEENAINCPSCEGRGDSDCVECDGNGYIDGKEPDVHQIAADEYADYCDHKYHEHKDELSGF